MIEVSGKAPRSEVSVQVSRSFVRFANRCFPCLLQARHLGRRVVYGSHVWARGVGDGVSKKGSDYREELCNTRAAQDEESCTE